MYMYMYLCIYIYILCVRNTWIHWQMKTFQHLWLLGILAPPEVPSESAGFWERRWFRVVLMCLRRVMPQVGLEALNLQPCAFFKACISVCIRICLCLYDFICMSMSMFCIYIYIYVYIYMYIIYVNKWCYISSWTVWTTSRNSQVPTRRVLHFARPPFPQQPVLIGLSHDHIAWQDMDDLRSLHLLFFRQQNTRGKYWEIRIWYDSNNYENYTYTSMYTFFQK